MLDTKESKKTKKTLVSRKIGKKDKYHSSLCSSLSREVEHLPYIKMTGTTLPLTRLLPIRFQDYKTALADEAVESQSWPQGRPKAT